MQEDLRKATGSTTGIRSSAIIKGESCLYTSMLNDMKVNARDDR